MKGQTTVCIHQPSISSLEGPLKELEHAARKVAEYVKKGGYQDILTSGNSGFISQGVLQPHLAGSHAQIHNLGDEGNQILYWDCYPSRKAQIDALETFVSKHHPDLNMRGNRILYVDDHCKSAFKLSELSPVFIQAGAIPDFAVLVGPYSRSIPPNREKWNETTQAHEANMDKIYNNTFKGSTNRELLHLFDILSMELSSGDKAEVDWYDIVPKVTVPKDYKEFLFFLSFLEEKTTGAHLIRPLLELRLRDG